MIIGLSASLQLIDESVFPALDGTLASTVYAKLIIHPAITASLRHKRLRVLQRIQNLRHDANRDFFGGFLNRGLAGDLFGKIDGDFGLAIDGDDFSRRVLENFDLDPSFAGNKIAIFGDTRRDLNYFRKGFVVCPFLLRRMSLSPVTSCTNDEYFFVGTEHCSVPTVHR